MSAKTVGVIGSGMVGQALASGFIKYGYRVKVGTRDPSKLAVWAAEAGPLASVGTMQEAAGFGEVVVLAVKGTGALDAVRLASPDALAGKVVLDATNPIADAPPQGGVLPFFTSNGRSLMEELQEAAPQARFVKAFSCVGSALMVDPQLPGGPPTMFICGNDFAAKAEAESILRRFGWEVDDVGGAEAARAIEPLCMLWCLPGFLKNDWSHAFKMLRP